MAQHQTTKTAGMVQSLCIMVATMRLSIASPKAANAGSTVENEKGSVCQARPSTGTARYAALVISQRTGAGGNEIGRFIGNILTTESGTGPTKFAGHPCQCPHTVISFQNRSTLIAVQPHNPTGEDATLRIEQMSFSTMSCAQRPSASYLPEAAAGDSNDGGRLSPAESAHRAALPSFDGSSAICAGMCWTAPMPRPLGSPCFAPLAVQRPRGHASYGIRVNT